MLDLGICGANPPNSGSVYCIMSFPDGSQPDVLRAAQKDDFHVLEFSRRIKDLAVAIVGSRNSGRWDRELSLASEIVYYASTTLAGRQTLGEEYCDLVQIDGKKGRLLTPWKRAALLFFQSIFPYALSRAMKRFEISTRPRYILRRGEPTFFEKHRAAFHRVAIILSRTSESFDKVHLALFYLTGLYYHISKRFVGVRMIFHHKLQDASQNRYGILGVLLFIQVAVDFWGTVREGLDGAEKDEQDDEFDEADGDSSEQKKCPLCQGSRRNTTASPCGHLFCWKCITEWCITKPECPLCRQAVQPRSLLLLQNYG